MAHPALGWDGPLQPLTTRPDVACHHQSCRWPNALEVGLLAIGEPVDPAELIHEIFDRAAHEELKRLARSPSVVQIVPLTRTIRGDAADVTIAADDHNGLDEDSAAQCQHIRAVATSRMTSLNAIESPGVAPTRNSSMA